jgi:hypothetical protein
MSLPINPETRVGALLEAYPELEETLIACAPAFAKLKNPVLRRTVARIATLEQAARIGGISVRDLVRRLREAAGQSGGEVEEPAPSPAAPEAPAWLESDRVRVALDADAVLAAGDHPLGKVRQSLANLEPGEILVVHSSFRPEPLLEALARSGLAVYSTEVSPERHATYIRRGH